MSAINVTAIVCAPLDSLSLEPPTVAQSTNIRTDDRQLAEAEYIHRARAFPDDGKPTLKGIQLAIDELVKENLKAKNVTPQQVIDLSFLP
jgi:hypothetical protein